jgi:hypothetical protein
MRDGVLLGFGAGLLLFSKKSFEGDAGCLLLGLLLGGAFGFSEGACASVAIGDTYFNAEELLMVRATLCGEDVLWLTCSRGLQVLLEGGLVIADGSGEGVTGRESTVEVGDRGFDDVALDKGAGGVETAVEVKRGDDGFESVGEQRGLLPTAALLFAAAEAEHGSEADALGDMAEVTAADERGAEAGEFALACVWEPAVEAVGDSETEDGVTNKFQLLVVGSGSRGSVGVGLVGEGTMGEGEREELGTPEAVVEEGRERLARCISCGLSTARWHADPHA